MNKAKDFPTTTVARARLAVATIFFISGVVPASWFVRIPAVQSKLELSPGTLGAVLLGSAIGSLISMPLAGWLTTRHGSRPLIRIAVTMSCISLPLLALAPNHLLLFATLLLFGISFGAQDVTMNTQGVAVEANFGRPIMSSLHGAFSIGGMFGALVGGAIAALDISPFQHLLGVAIVMGVLGQLACGWLLPPTADARAIGPAFAWPSGSLLVLGVIAFCVLLGEGAIADWSAVYLNTVLGVGPGMAAAGYAVFSMTMALGRFGGDRLIERLGLALPVRLGGALAAGGMGAALIIEQPWAAFIGFACAGLGFALIFPIMVIAAARTQEMAPSAAIAAISTTGYFGFLIGPPLIGFAADLLTLSVALGILVILSASITLLAGAVERVEDRDG